MIYTFSFEYEEEPTISSRDTFKGGNIVNAGFFDAFKRIEELENGLSDDEIIERVEILKGLMEKK
jgi:hypothetical protein